MPPDTLDLPLIHGCAQGVLFLLGISGQCLVVDFYLVLGHLISTAQQHIELSFDWPRQELSSLVFGSLLCFAIQAAAAPNNVFAVLIFGCAPRIPLGFSHSHRRSGLATSDSDSSP
jgi:hypothetical protein